QHEPRRDGGDDGREHGRRRCTPRAVVEGRVPVELRKGGLHVTGTPLWLDARRKSELSFVSHAHTDHIARHERVIATAATLRIMEHRLGPLQSTLSTPYHRPFKLGDLTVELKPAGHVLGSAQI